MVKSVPERQQRQRQPTRAHRLGDAVVHLRQQVRRGQVRRAGEHRPFKRVGHPSSQRVSTDAAQDEVEPDAEVVRGDRPGDPLHGQGQHRVEEVDEPQAPAVGPPEQVGAYGEIALPQRVRHPPIAPDVVPDVVAGVAEGEVRGVWQHRSAQHGRQQRVQRQHAQRAPRVRLRICVKAGPQGPRC